MKPWKPPPEDDENKSESPAPPIPREPDGRELTRRRSNIEHTREKMQVTADEITRLLQSEQIRQNRYRKRGK